MANQYKKTIVLGMDTTQFTSGVTNAKSQMSLLTAEFKRDSEEAKLNGTAVDQLRVKHDYLKQKIELQKQVVADAAAKYDKLSSSNTANARAVEQAEKAMLNQQAALYKMQNELGDTDKELEKVTKDTKSMGDVLRSTFDVLGVQVNPAIENFISGLDGVDASVGEAVAVIAGLTAAYADLSVSAAGWADELLTQSTITGLSVEELQGLDYVSKLLDTDTNTITGSMAKLEKQMYSAANGSEEQRKIFAKLRISYKDASGELQSSQSVFLQAIDALGKISNETERDAVAMQLFGKSAKELTPLIEAGSDGFRDAMQAAKDYGLVIGEDNVQALGRLQDQLDIADMKIDTVKRQLGLVLANVLTPLLSILNKISPELLTTVTVFGSLVAVGLTLSKVFTAYNTIAAITSTLNTSMGASAMMSVGSFGALAAIILAVCAAIAVLIGYGPKLIDTLRGVNSATSVAGSAAYSAGVPRYNARGTEYFEGGETWVGEDGPELVSLPRGSRIRNAKDSNTATTNIYNVTLDAHNVKDWQDIVRLMQQEQTSYRVGRVGV